MHNSQGLEKVLSLRQEILAGDEKRLKEQRDAGKLTARERIAKIADAGSFVELFALVSRNDEGAGVITGYATIEERPVYLFAQDFTVRGGAMGQLQAAKIVKLLDLAQKTGAPVLALMDSAGVRIDEGAQALSAYSEIYQKMARMSGVCPMVALVLGPCIGGAALLSQLADVSIVAEKVGQLMVFGPQVMAAMSGAQVDAEKFGGAKVAAETGACALTAASEDEALLKARQVLALLPSSNLEDTEIVDTDDLNRLLPAIDPADVDALLNAVADQGTLVELYAAYEPSVKVALARLGGRSVGIVANNPAEHNGVLCASACKKAARFIRLCDCFNIPVVTLVNTPGQNTVDEEKNAAAVSAAAQLIFAYAEAVVPKVSVLCGQAVGAAYSAMGSKAVGADAVYAWPKAYIAPINAEAAVRILEKEEIRAGKPVAELAKFYEENNGALAAAEEGLCDDVIEPAATRQMIAAALEMLMGKREVALPRKHGNLPL